MSDSTGTVSIYNFRHVVITATGTNWTRARRSLRPLAENISYEEIYVSLPNNIETTVSELTFIRPYRTYGNIKYIKYVTNFPSITNASSLCNGYSGLIEFNCPSNFLPNCTSLHFAFSTCNNLTKVSLFDTSSVTNFRNFFNNCYLFSGGMKYDFSSATDMRSTFASNRNMRIARDLSLPNVTNLNSIFASCSGLIEAGDLYAPNATGAYRLYSGCNNLKKLGTLTLSSATDWEQTFYSCVVLESIDNVIFKSSGTVDFYRTYGNTYALKTAFVPDSAVSYTDLYQAFVNTMALEEIKPAGVTMNASSLTSNNNNLRQVFKSSGLYYLPNITFSTSTFSGNVSNIFANMKRLKEVPAYDLSALTVPLSNNNLFFQTSITGTHEIQRIRATGIACTFTIRDSHMSADALDELMTNCATVTGKTMDLRNNPGTANCDTTIATNKGWTVTT